MRVKAVVSFTAKIGKTTYNKVEGQEFELPEGADWLTSGLVVPAVDDKIETATVKPAETRTKRSRSTRSSKK